MLLRLELLVRTLHEAQCIQIISLSFGIVLMSSQIRFLPSTNCFVFPEMGTIYSMHRINRTAMEYKICMPKDRAFPRGDCFCRFATTKKLLCEKYKWSIYNRNMLLFVLKSKWNNQVLSSAQFINGPAVKSFQSNLESYLGVKHVIPCANGTDALQVAMMGLGLEPGDEVITADFTFAATVEVIALLGLTPVLVDVDPNSFNIDPNAIVRAITPKTKAIVPVHLFGQVADMDAIMAIAENTISM